MMQPTAELHSERWFTASWFADHWLVFLLLAVGIGLAVTQLVRRKAFTAWSGGILFLVLLCVLDGLGGLILPPFVGFWVAIVGLVALFSKLIVVVLTGRW